MATRFVRVNLSDSGRDFSPIAVEPGVPMLDRSGANAKILYHWLGGLLAEPVWEGECVNFYVRDDRGGRLEEAICQPASEGDLKTILKDDVEKLRTRLAQCRPETPTERVLHRVVQRTFQELVDDPNRTDLDSYFYRYRDVTGAWRLTWCWGYQRTDQEPAPAVVCNEPSCNLLFVRRPGKSPKCPDCEALWSFRPMRTTNWRMTAVAALLLLLLLGLVGWWTLRPSRLVVTPNIVKGLVGNRVEFQATQKSLFRSKNITREVIGVTYDPRVARFNQATSSATLTGPGTAEIHFHYGDLTAVVAVDVEPGANPEKLQIEPRIAEIGVGTTARLKAVGEYKDGRKADLTDAVEWKALSDGIVFSQGGLVEGVAQGSTTISARYRANPQSPYVDAAANVSVAKMDFKSLEVAVEPSAIRPGLPGTVRADVLGDDGKRYSVLESSLLRTEVSPPGVATFRGRHLEGERTGNGNLAAAFGPALTAEAAFTVGNPPRVAPEIHPTSMDLVVGEIADISYLSPSRERISMTSSSPRIADVTTDNRIFGRSVGEAQVTVVQGDRPLGTVDVSVSQVEFQAISIDPGSIGVPVDGMVRPRVYGWVKGSDPMRSVEIAPQFLTADKLPSPRYAEFNPNLLELRGAEPTPPKSPETLALRLGANKAAAPVEVMVAPCLLEISPAGPVIEVPVGQLIRLQGWATYTGGRRVQVPAERLRWSSEEKAVAGLRLYDGRVGASQSGAGPLTVYADYFGRESNRVAFKSVDADPNVRLALGVDRTLRTSGESGQTVLTATSPAGDVELVPDAGIYKSSDDKTIKIGEKTGAFAAGAPGEATVTATHPAAKGAATLALQVRDPKSVPRVVAEYVVIKSDQGPLVRFPVGAIFSDFRVEAHYADGFTRLVTKRATIRTPEPPESAILTASGGRLIGVRPGATQVTAEYDGVKSQDPPLKVEVLGSVDLDKLVVEPGPITIRPGESVGLRAMASKDGKSIGDITGLGVQWKSSDERFARMNGSTVAGVGLGQAGVTAHWNAVASAPAQVLVTDSITDNLRIEPRTITIPLGGSVRIGPDVQVFRGDMDVSRQVSVTPLSPGVVRWVPQTRELVAEQAGRAAVAITVGDKLFETMVEVVGALAINGDLLVEPASVTLAPGQAEALRVFELTPQGDRVDVTARCVFRSTDEKIVKVIGGHACALAPGQVDIMAMPAMAPGSKAGRAVVRVNNEEITELMVDPKQLNMSVNDRMTLGIFGRAPTAGIHEMFPQVDLKVAPARQGVVAVLGGNEIQAVGPGQDTIDVDYRGKLRQQVQASVAVNPYTDLRIEPPAATIHQGDALPYAVTAMRGGQRYVLTAADGVQLLVERPEVAQVLGNSAVMGSSPGTTAVVAQFGGQRAEASLQVTPQGAVVVDGGGTIVGPDPTGGVVFHPGQVIYGGDGRTRIYDPNRIYREPGGRVITGPDVVLGPGTTQLVETAPAGRVVGLCFRPDLLQMGANAEPALVRVFEALEGGLQGRDVTADPGLQISEPGECARLEKTAQGPVIRPVQAGQS
ncbi:MAG: hypothetical protein ABR915_09700, partial [Thermoguttaceae bacterium]